MSVSDRWHKAHPKPEEPCCADHERVPTAVHGRGDRWQVRWRDDEGKQRAQTFTKKAAADSFDAKMKSNLDAGLAIDVAGGRTKVTDYFERWVETLTWREASFDRLRGTFRHHIKPVIGHLAIGQVRASHIRAIMKRASATLAPASMIHVHTDLASMFNAAVADRLIGTSPVAGIKPPQLDRRAHFVPTPDQVHVVASALDERYAAAAYVAAGCGLRLGEILGLELDAVDFLRREIDVRQQLVTPSKGTKAYIGPTKTPTSVRTVELPEVTQLALAEHVSKYPPVEVEIEDRTDPRKPVTRTARLLFTMPNGRPLHRRAWSDAWATGRDAAGIPKGNGIHSFRHYFATLLIHGGASVKTVQLALGHATPAMTLNTYTHEWPEAHEKTRLLVDAALGRVQQKCTPKIAQA